MSFFLRMPRRGFGFLFIAFLLVHLTSQLASAQLVKQEWEQRYDSAIPTFETSSFSAVDAAGNTYVAGNSSTSTQRSPTNHDGYVIAKLNPTGEVLWQHRFPFVFYPHAVVDVALDDTGFYVVVSTVEMGSRTSVDVIKYALEDGQQLWQQSETPFTTMVGIQVLPDNKGGVILVGSGLFVLPGDYTQLFKYDAATGERLWRQVLSGSESSNVYEHLAGIALDSQGDIYLTGSTGIEENVGQMLTTKRSGEDGSLIWQQQYNTDLQDRAMQLAVDDAGGVYSWGIHYTNDPSQPTANTLLKYDAATGRQVWRKRKEGAAIPEQLVADESGGLYLRTSLQGQSRLARYSIFTGSQRWSTTFAGSGIDMVADAAGNLYLGSRQSDEAYTVRRYNARRGNIAWTYNSVADSTYLLRELALSEAGTLHLSGTAGDISKHVFATSLQSATGAHVYTLTFRHTFSGVDVPANMATDDAGNVYVTVSTGPIGPTLQSIHVYLLKYSTSGELLWTRQFYDSTVEEKHLAVDPAGSVYVMTQVYDSDARPSITLRKLSAATGEIIWRQEHGPTDANVGRELQLDQQGNVYIMGTVSTHFIPSLEDYLIKVDGQTGHEIWTRRFGRIDPSSDVNELVAFTTDESGDVYVTGTARAPAVVNNLGLIKYAGSDGNMLWSEIYNSRDRYTEHQVSGIAVDKAGGLFLAAHHILDTGQQVAYLLKFEAASGAFVWRQPTIDAVTNSGRLANLLLDNAGGAYVTTFNNLVVKLSTGEPAVVWTSPFQGGAIVTTKLDDAGGIYVAYRQTDGMQVLKYQTSDGAKVWDVLHEGELLYEKGLMALDGARNVFLANSAFSPDTNYDLLLAKYSQTTDEPACAIPVNVQLYLAPYAIRAGWEARTTADFSPHILDEDTGLRWTWGDGSEPTMSYTAFGTSRITGKHTYTQAGIYQVGLDFSESCLEPTNGDYNQWHVIYDPEAGWVQGSGSLTLDGHGKGGNRHKGRLEAEFSFSVRYQNKHATRPQGTLQLIVNQQKFTQSGALDWLVVTGDQAIWKGMAQLQGVGRYGYIVAVHDAGGRGKNDPNDQLRIRIWDLDRGNALVFDNFKAGGDIYDLSGETGPRIVRGNIVINGKNKHSNLHAKSTKGVQGMTPSDLQVYPNPASATATLRFALQADDAYEVALYDLKGALVQRVRQGQAGAGEAIEVQVDVSALTKGLYLLRLESTGYRESVKLIVAE